MRSSLVLQLLNGVGPLEGLGRLIVASNEIEDGLLQLGSAGKMGGLQELALEPTSPDLDLIQPGGVTSPSATLRTAMRCSALRR